MQAEYFHPRDSKGLRDKPHPLKGQPGAGTVATPVASRKTKGKRK